VSGYSTSGTTAQPTQTLKIGAVVPFNMKEGIEITKWLKLFAKIYNEQGGWEIGGQKCIVEPIVYDLGMGTPEPEEPLPRDWIDSEMLVLMDRYTKE
jgi:hypothetical protein